MDLDWLRDFLALAEHRAFSRAAQVRHVTQPTFSRRIRALEEWVGADLFIRSAQGASLTPAGAHFLPRAEDLVQQLSQARATTRKIGERKRSTLAIAATHALSFTFFPGWIRERVSFEHLATVNLVSDSMDACEGIMLAGEVDYLLCHHHPAAPSRLEDGRFRSVQVGLDTLVPVSAPDGEGRPLWPLAAEPDRPTRFLAYSVASGLGRILDAVRPNLGAGPRETVFTSHLAATLATMAGEGHGAAWLPLTTVRADLASSRLVWAAPPDLDVPVEIRLFYRTERELSAEGIALGCQGHRSALRP